LRFSAGMLLLSIWGSLRFSDCQHVHIHEISWDTHSLRGLVYRAKAARRGMAFGAVGCGFYNLPAGSCWLSVLLALLDARLCALDRECGPGTHRRVDYLHGHFEEGEYRPAGYGRSLGTLRLLLSKWRGCPEPSIYTLHSCKVTFLAWMLQMDLAPASRACQGHHVSGSLALYGREDVLPALRAQESLRKAILGGWRPLCPVVRGGAHAASEPEPVFELLHAVSLEPLKLLQASPPNANILLDPALVPAAESTEVTLVPIPKLHELQENAASAGPASAPQESAASAGPAAAPPTEPEPVSDSASEASPVSLGAREEVCLVKCPKSRVVHVADAVGAPLCGAVASDWVPLLEMGPQHRMCKHRRCSHAFPL
jgi:hypothetical protein